MPPAMLRIFSKTIQGILWLLAKIDERFGNIVIKLEDDGLSESPYDVVAKVRPKGNILRSYMINGWYVIGYHEITELLRESRLSNAISTNRFMNLIMRSSAQGLDIPFLDYPSMQQVDAPDHTRLRKLTSKGFTRKYIQSLAPTIEKLVDELLDEIPDSVDQFDVVTGLSRPLPAIVIAEMLGVPKKERHLFEKWSADMLGFVEILNPPQLRTAVEGEIAMRVYLQDLVEYKREHPGQDLISELIAVEEDGDKLTLDELYSTCELLLIAGHETTTRLIGSCLHLLMENPEQLQEVRASDELLEGAIEEALRFEPPIMAISRTVTESFIYMGKKFRKGQIIMLSIAGASRDPEVNDLPDRFDAHRDKVTHVSFGHGIHLCLGMSLARLEAQIGLRKLLDRYETINPLNDTPTWESNPFFRGLEHLHVKVSESSL